MTRKLHQATRRSPARGTSERLGTRLLADEVRYGPRLGLGGLYQQNFGNNRHEKALSIMRE